MADAKNFIVTGGGTYGHVSPLEPIAGELRKLGHSVHYIGMKGDRFGDLLEAPSKVDVSHRIWAGKYRRYPNETTLERLFDFRTHALNIRDVARLIRGYAAARRILKKVAPDAVFGKGGYVSVPVGLAAKHLGIPLVIHESDSRLGMANKLLLRHAEILCLGMPIQDDESLSGVKTQFTGVPVREEFLSVKHASKNNLLKKLNLHPNKPIVTVSGGSLGAEAINSAVVKGLSTLLESFQIVHIAGDANIDAVRKQSQQSGADLSDYHVIGFTKSIEEYFEVSDVIVTRASATTFSELAVLGKAIILIPAKQLSDQIENARRIEAKQAAMVLDERKLETDTQLLTKTLIDIASDPSKQQKLQQAIEKLARPDASRLIANALISTARK